MSDPTPSTWLARTWPPLAAAAVSAVLATVLHQTGAVPVPRPAAAPQPRPAPERSDATDPARLAPPPRPVRSYGWVRPAADEVPEKVFSLPHAGPLPPACDLLAPAPGVPGLPFDQGQLGSCGPNAAGAAVMLARARAGLAPLPPPSRLFVYYTTRALMGTTRQDSGVSNTLMFRALRQSGWCAEPLWPYDVSRFRQRPPAAAYAAAAENKVADAAAVGMSLAALKTCLAVARQPVVVGFEVFPSFETPEVDRTGDVPMPARGEEPVGGHDVLVVGYDDARQRFRFLNSYGPGWGAKGFGTLPYAYLTSPALAGDFWTIGHGAPNPNPQPGPRAEPPGITIDPARKLITAPPDWTFAPLRP